MGFLNQSDSISSLPITKVVGDTRSRAFEALQKYRLQHNQQLTDSASTNLKTSLPNALAHYSSSRSEDTSCARLK